MIKKQHNYSTPNMNLVHKTIQYNRGIRDAILKEIADRKYREEQERLRIEQEQHRIEQERIRKE